MRSRKKAFHRFLTFFLSTAFIVTCNLVLFLQYLNLEENQIRRAAPVTMANVVLLTVIFWLIDTLRYHLTIVKPLREIQGGIDKAIRGDFSAHIEASRAEYFFNEYGEIISELNKLFEELKSVETLRTDFISSVSHEMKTPMAVIQNYGTLLQTPDLSDEKRIEYSKKITEQTRKLSGMVTNILRLNKLENQHIFPDKEQINLSEHICESLLPFEEIWEKRSLNVITNLDEDADILGDSEMLDLVWTNLMSNAVKFTEDGGSITVTTSLKGEMAVAEFQDTGCGMDSETGMRIFQKFYQGDTSHASEGNGLGLSLVKRIVDIHGGEINVSSEIGRGSTFTVRLPALQSAS